MKFVILLFTSIMFLQILFAQDTAISKMNRTNDRNRVTDTVNAGGTNDKMNVYSDVQKDSIRQSDSLSNFRTDTVPAEQITPTPAKERVWVSRGVWIAVIVIIIAIVISRRKRRK